MGPIYRNPNQTDPQTTLDTVRRRQEKIGKELRSSRKQTMLWFFLFLVIVIALTLFIIHP